MHYFLFYLTLFNFLRGGRDPLENYMNTVR
jgi:hypothetical protein